MTLASEVGSAAGRPGAEKTLFLDLDGTLAPIVSDPAEARVPRTTLKAMERLVDNGWRVIVVSGRPRKEARRMVPDRRISVYGGHGWEGLPSSPSMRDALGRIRAVGRRAVSLEKHHPGARVERKPAGIAFHDRQVSRDRLAAWRGAVAELLDRSDLRDVERLPGRRVLELRPVGMHKGSVITHVLGSRAGTTRDASLVALGDDTTDEDMFRAIGRRGLSVRVGLPGAVTTAARRLASPHAASRFLWCLSEMGTTEKTTQEKRRRGGKRLKERR